MTGIKKYSQLVKFPLTVLWKSINREGQQENTIMLFAKPIEQPWAFAHRKGFKGDAPGLYFRYYEKREEAEKARSAVLRKGKYAGEIEHRPNESWFAGYV
jgi:hypothetical protein